MALATGAARGQGHSNAARLAQEGADIIAVDICDQIESTPYPMATRADLAETGKLVEQLDRRVVAEVADVRERGQLAAAVEAAFGHLGPGASIICIGSMAGLMPGAGDRAPA